MTPSNDKAAPGQPFRVPPAEVWNGMVDAGNAYRAGRLSTDTPERKRRRQPDEIKIKNASGANRARGQILRFTGKALEDLEDESIWLTGGEPTADGFFGILKEPIETDAVGLAQVSGCCMALIDVSDTGHTRATPVAADYVLASSDSGPLEILYKPSGTGELECVVRFASAGGGGGSTFVAELTAAWSTNFAACEIYTMDGTTLTLLETSTVFDPLAAFDVLTTGDRLYVTKQGGKYYAANNAPCPTGGGGAPEPL